MKTIITRLAGFALLAALAAPAFWGCNSETAFAKDAREAVERRKAVEDTIIRNYLVRRNIANYTRTESGLYLINTADGSGPLVRSGNRVSVRYIGRMLGRSDVPNSADRTGEVFETTYENRTACRCNAFIVGSQVIGGWSEGLQLMQLGSRKTLLIPSHLAYGTGGSPNGIPPNQPLMFDMDITAVAP